MNQPTEALFWNGDDPCIVISSDDLPSDWRIRVRRMYDNGIYPPEEYLATAYDCDHDELLLYVTYQIRKLQKSIRKLGISVSADRYVSWLSKPK